MAGRMITLDAPEGGRFGAYLARPPAEPGPAIVLLHEPFGLTRWVRHMADAFAARGYLVCAPDLFWRLQPDFVAEPADAAAGTRANELADELDRDLAIGDIGATLEAAKAMPESNGAVAAAGFGLGGTLAYLAATRLKIDAAAAYYGPQIPEFVNEGSRLACPIAFHLAERDQMMSEKSRKRIFAALIGIPHVSIYSYDADHAFANADRPDRHDADAAELAHTRTFAIFDTLRQANRTRG